MIDLFGLAPIELLSLHARVADELRNRRITRTSNNPTGNLSEYLFCKAFHWKQEANSNANIDAKDGGGICYQIKGRRITRHKNSRQLSANRDFEGKSFDFLAGVIFSEDYTVMRAAIIPHIVVLKRAIFVPRTNSHRFLLRDEVWDAPEVRDVTAELRAVMQ